MLFFFAILIVISFAATLAVVRSFEAVMQFFTLNVNDNNLTNVKVQK